MKVAVLVIASAAAPGGGDAYASMLRAWEVHAAAAPPGFDVRFLWGGAAPDGPPDGHAGPPGTHMVFPDIPESLIPGILDKTLAALPAFREHDFVVRTNLSSWYHWAALADFLAAAGQDGPRLAAGFSPDRSHLSGCNLIMGRRVVEHVLAASAAGAVDRTVLDDLALSRVIMRAFAPTWVARAEPLVDGTVRRWACGVATEFHVRLKNPGAREYDARVMWDLVRAYDPDERGVFR